MIRYETKLALSVIVGLVIGGVYYHLPIIQEHPLIGDTKARDNRISLKLHLDTGHTPSNPGAISSSCIGEYEYNEYTVESILRYDASNIVTSSIGEQTFKDRENSSEDRDLFLSIHHDSMNEKWLHRNAKGCLEGNHTKGYSLFVSDKNIDYNKSIDYARQISEYMLAHGGVVNISHGKPSPDGSDREVIDSRLGIYNYPNLRVLKNAHSPAVLIEMGVITNPLDNEEESLYQMSQRLAEALDGLVKIK